MAVRILSGTRFPILGSGPCSPPAFPGGPARSSKRRSVPDGGSGHHTDGKHRKFDGAGLRFAFLFGTRYGALTASRDRLGIQFVTKGPLRTRNFRQNRVMEGSGVPTPEYEPGDFVFYPRVGHCEVGGVIRDERTGLDLLELTPQEVTGAETTQHRILIPTTQLSGRGIRRPGHAPGVIADVLGSDFEPTIEDATERLDLINAQERDGSVAALALALKRLHLRREMKTITRQEERHRTRIRKWLVLEYMAEQDCSSGQAQAAITRLLSATMNKVRTREKEAARKRRKAERAARIAREAEKRRRKGRT